MCRGNKQRRTFFLRKWPPWSLKSLQAQHVCRKRVRLWDFAHWRWINLRSGLDLPYTTLTSLSLLMSKPCLILSPWRRTTWILCIWHRRVAPALPGSLQVPVRPSTAVRGVQKSASLRVCFVASGGVGSCHREVLASALVSAFLFQLRFYFHWRFLKLLFLLALLYSCREHFHHTLVVCSWTEKNSFRTRVAWESFRCYLPYTSSVKPWKILLSTWLLLRRQHQGGFLNWRRESGLLLLPLKFRSFHRKFCLRLTSVT